MADRKKKNRTGINADSWYDPSDWGYKPSEDFKITIRMIPIVIVLILGFSLGLTHTGNSANAAKRALIELGGDHRAQLEEAYSLVVAGDYTAGVSLALRVLHEDPENALAYNILGLAHARRGLTEEAALNFEKATKSNPDFAMAWYNLGVVEESRGEFERALTAYRQATELEPDNKTYNDATAQMEGIIIGEAGWEWHEIEGERLFLEGVSAVNRGEHDDLIYAENIFRTLVMDRPYDVASRNMLGLALANQGELDEAERLFIQVVEAEPGFSDAWYNLGMLHRNQGRLEEALDDFMMANFTSSLESFKENASSMADEIREMLNSESIVTTPDDRSGEVK